MADGSLALWSRGSQMLAEANTIQKTKELKDMALTAAVWAKQRKMGKATVQTALNYALEAERKMGGFLIASKPKRAKGGNPRLTSRTPRLVEAEPTLNELGITRDESYKAQKLAKLPEETFLKIKSGEVPRAHVGQATGENEWYTPPEYIEAVHAVMGCIDCDPASSETANKTVKATVFYTKADDGIKQKWGKRVWMNPPYAQPLISQFSEALCTRLDNEVEEACVLVNNATETAWFQAMLQRANAVCFIAGRVRFLDPKGNPGSPLQGQALLYFGKNVEKFSGEFSSKGIVLYGR